MYYYYIIYIYFYSAVVFRPAGGALVHISSSYPSDLEILSTKLTNRGPALQLSWLFLFFTDQTHCSTKAPPPPSLNHAPPQQLILCLMNTTSVLDLSSVPVTPRLNHLSVHMEGILNPTEPGVCRTQRWRTVVLTRGWSWCFSETSVEKFDWSLMWLFVI